MNATSEQALEEFYEFLETTGKNELNKPLKGENYAQRSQNGTKFSQCVSRLANTYGFGRKEAAERILSNPKLADSFSIIACHWIMDCSMKYRKMIRNVGNYTDLRDKASAEMCMRVTSLPEWEKTYCRLCGDYCYAENWEVTSVGAYYVSRCIDVHPTLRQTFTGLVLTYIMTAPDFVKLSNQLLSDGVVESRDIHFCMI